MWKCDSVEVWKMELCVANVEVYEGVEVCESLSVEDGRWKCGRWSCVRPTDHHPNARVVVIS